MNQLVAQGVHAIQDDREYSHCLVVDQSMISCLSGPLEARFPLLLTDLSIVEVPERLKKNS